jgi:hypothetical protein
LSKWDPNNPLSLDLNYLRNKAEGLLDKIDDGHTLGTILPSTIYGPAGAKRAIEQDAAGGGGDPPSKKGKANPNSKHPPSASRSAYVAPLTTAALLASAEVSNDHTMPDWLLPKGLHYYDFFVSKDKSTRGWPLLDDPCLPNGPAPMCIRFQTTGKCRLVCRMAHVLPDMITANNQRRIVSKWRMAIEPTPDYRHCQRL